MERSTCRILNAESNNIQGQNVAKDYSFLGVTIVKEFYYFNFFF
jgi:hypothetical protein